MSAINITMVTGGWKYVKVRPSRPDSAWIIDPSPRERERERERLTDRQTGGVYIALFNLRL